MANIAGKETKPEIAVRKALFANGYRFRKNVKNLPGKPDIVLKKYHTAIFINGCFWHGHKNCKYAQLPKSNTDFWSKKISDNSERDKANFLKLKALKWTVIEIWQCQINSKATFDQVVSKVISRLKK